MDRPAADLPGADHWAPEHLVLARRVLSHAGRLLVGHDAEGRVMTHRPLSDMAAVEHRYPSWALGPFGHVEPETDPPAAPGVFALVQAGVVRYVGSSRDLSRTLGPQGIGTVSRRDAQRRDSEERCRLNHRVVAEARVGRVVDLYLLATGSRTLLGGIRGERPEDVAAEITADVRGAWHLPV